MNGTAQAPSTARVFFLPTAGLAPVTRAKRRGRMPKVAPVVLSQRAAELQALRLKDQLDDAHDACLSAYEEQERLKRELVAIATRIGEKAAEYERAQDVRQAVRDQIAALKRKEVCHA